MNNCPVQGVDCPYCVGQNGCGGCSAPEGLCIFARVLQQIKDLEKAGNRMFFARPAPRIILDPENDPYSAWAKLVGQDCESDVRANGSMAERMVARANEMKADSETKMAEYYRLFEDKIEEVESLVFEFLDPEPPDRYFPASTIQLRDLARLFGVEGYEGGIERPPWEFRSAAKQFFKDQGFVVYLKNDEFHDEIELKPKEAPNE